MATATNFGSRQSSDAFFSLGAFFSRCGSKFKLPPTPDTTTDETFSRSLGSHHLFEELSCYTVTQLHYTPPEQLSLLDTRHTVD
jgi:hypothetical protein